MSTVGYLVVTTQLDMEKRREAALRINFRKHDQGLSKLVKTWYSAWQHKLKVREGYRYGS